MQFTSRQLALHAARLASDKGASDIVVLQLPEIAGTPFDYVVLATATSDRQTNAVVEEIFHFCKRHSVPRMPVEGESGWMLIDCFDVVVHALSSEQRAHYDLDHLWSMAKSVTKWEAESKTIADPDRPAPVKAATVQATETPAKAAPRKRRAASRAPGSEENALVKAGVLPPDFEQPKPKRKRTGGSPKKSAAKSVTRRAPKISAKAPAKRAPSSRKSS